MCARADSCLRREDAYHLILSVETANDRLGIDAKIVQPIPTSDAAPVILTARVTRRIERNRVDGFAGMAAVCIVHSDMQGEVIGIDAEFVQLIGSDQEVERQLLVSQIEADDLGQHGLGRPAQCELNRPLLHMVVTQMLPLAEPVGGQQRSVEQDVIFRCVAIPEFLQIGLNQAAMRGSC